MASLLLFLALQFCDLMTTLVFLHRGVAEANPLITALVHVSAQSGVALLLIKMAGCGLGFYAWKSSRIRLLRCANVFYALCVAWNLLVIAIA
jgi:hypothetical protein